MANVIKTLSTIMKVLKNWKNEIYENKLQLETMYLQDSPVGLAQAMIRWQHESLWFATGHPN